MVLHADSVEVKVSWTREDLLPVPNWRSERMFDYLGRCTDAEVVLRYVAWEQGELDERRIGDCAGRE
jgi:hypothetical protein